MDTVRLTINGQQIDAAAGTSILEAARRAGIYIPGLCSHPNLPPGDGIEASDAIYQGDRKIGNARPGEPGKGCGLCLVEVENEPELVRSCATEVKPGMVLVTENPRISAQRRENLIPILARHRHACLTCAQQEGCSLTHCSSNVPENERCCTRFGHCELQKVADYVGISPSTPGWVPTGLPVLENQALFVRDYDLCIGCTRCVRACRELRGIGAIGFVFDRDGEIRVGSVAPTLEDSGCKFCTACVEVCPAGALMDRSVRPGRMEQDLVPCREACPAHVDVPGYLRLVAAGKRDEANAVIREKVPFPGVLGRACIRPCEEVCRRGEVNDPVSICALKRYAADGEKGLWKKSGKVGHDTGRKVAVVGAGPAGLTAAFYLRKQGHRVTVFEARGKAGGMMRYGIPRYRLPEEILDREIDDILETGVEFVPNKVLGRDLGLQQLKADGYDAVFLGVGARSSRRIPLEGSDLPGVWWGVDFLCRVAEGREIRLRDRVIVIGGGNVAVDAARTAYRCGAKEVTLACLERREEMPAHDREVEGALAEGVRLMPSWGPHRILSRDGGITGMELIHCVSAFDDRRVFSPSFDGTVQRVEGDQVILAVGQIPDLSFLDEGSAVSVNRGFMVVDGATQETGMNGIYAGGDAAGAPGSIIHAVAAGRRAAASIDKALGGNGEIDEVLFERPSPGQFLGRDEGFASWPRERVSETGIAAGHRGFQEVAPGFGDDQAVREAKRCLQCDLRLYLSHNPSPPERLLAFTEDNVNRVPEDEGVFVLYDGEKNVLAVRGTAALRETLRDSLKDYKGAAWFRYEEDRMYSLRETEMIQQYLREHGAMPGGDEDDDLF